MSLACLAPFAPGLISPRALPRYNALQACCSCGGGVWGVDGEIPARGPVAVNTAEDMCIKLSGCRYRANFSDGTAFNGTRPGYVPGGTIWANGLQIQDDAPPLTGVRHMHIPLAALAWHRSCTKLTRVAAQMCEPIELTATGNVYAKQQDANLNLQVWSDAQLNPHGTCTPAGSSDASRATVAAAALLVLAWAY